MAKSLAATRQKQRKRKLVVGLLREARLKAGLRQVDLAKALGQPQSFISKYESGERRLDLTELDEVCRAVGIRLGAFVRRFEEAVRSRTTLK